MPNGEVQCLVAARPPVALENAIKQEQELFYTALGKVEAEAIMQFIPVTHPSTNLIDEALPGIAKFPIAEWMRDKGPVLTEVGWLLLAELVRRREPKLQALLGRILDRRLQETNLDQVHGWKGVMSAQTAPWLAL